MANKHRTIDPWDQVLEIIDRHGGDSHEFDEFLKAYEEDERFVGNVKRRANLVRLEQDKSSKPQDLMDECFAILRDSGPDSVEFYDFLKRNAAHTELVGKARRVARVRRELLKQEKMSKRGRS